MEAERILEIVKEYWRATLSWTIILIVLVFIVTGHKPHPGYDHPFKLGDVVCM